MARSVTLLIMNVFDAADRDPALKAVRRRAMSPPLERQDARPSLKSGSIAPVKQTLYRAAARSAESTGGRFRPDVRTCSRATRPRSGAGAN